MLDNSHSQTPVMFILSVGVDPTETILKYCQQMEISLETVSLGQGQGKKAEAMIDRAKQDGNWVLLNNCHLSKTWLSKL